MEFEAVRKESVMITPDNPEVKRTTPAEIRTDPLTGRTARICHFMDLKWPKPDFDAIVKGTEKMCPFCPDKVHNITPLFPKEIAGGGRLRNADMVLFPNLAPYDCISAVATMGAEHYIPMTEFTEGRIAGAFGLAMDFFRKLSESGHAESVYQIINWNYMPPAGSSLIHPHLQVFASSSAPNLLKEELTASVTYMKKNGANFWDTLVETEKRNNERYLGKIGRSHWISSFAPMGVAGDVIAVVDNVSSTLSLTKGDIGDLASGLTRLMAAYDKMGIYSFNMNFFTGAAEDDAYRFHILFSPRAFFNQSLGTPDVGALRNLYNETLCMAYPEEITKMLMPEFDDVIQ